MHNESDKPESDRFLVELVDGGLTLERFPDCLFKPVHVRDYVRGKYLERNHDLCQICSPSRVLRSRISGTCRDGRSRGISRNARWLFRRIVGMETLLRLRVAVSCVRTSCRRAFEQCELPSTSTTLGRGLRRIICFRACLL